MKRMTKTGEGLYTLEVLVDGMLWELADVEELKRDHGIFKEYRVRSRFMREAESPFSMGVYISTSFEEFEYALTDLIYHKIIKQIEELRKLKTALEERE